MTSQKPQSPAMEFLVSALKTNSKASYADLKAKADEKKLKVFPVMFGRAKLLLGLVKAAKRGTGRFAKANAAKRGAATEPAVGTGRGRKPDANSKSGKIRELLKTDMTVSDIAKKLGCTPALVYNVKARMGGGGTAKRGPGSLPKAKAASPGLDGLAGILDAVKNSERERTQLRAALERIHGILADALA